MTNEEELAKEYADKMADVGLKKDCYINIKEAFLAGYKKGVYRADKENERLRKEIGRLQVLLADEVHKHKVTRDKLEWHKVADGDLPDTNRDVLVICKNGTSLTDWRILKNTSWAICKDEEVIAWCEIPKYED